MTGLKHGIGSRIKRAVNLGELQRMLIFRYVRQPRAGQQEAREADRAVVVVIGQPRRQLLYGPLCRLGVTNAHDIGAIEL